MPRHFFRLLIGCSVALMALTLAACGSSEQPVAPATSAPTSQAPEYRIDPPLVADVAVDAAAVDAFGADKAASGYEEAVDFASSVLLTGDRAWADYRELTVDDFSDVTSRMTSSYAADWEAALKEALTEGPGECGAECQRVAFTVFWSLSGETAFSVTPRPDGLLVTNQVVSSPSVSVDDAGRLLVTFHHYAEMTYLMDGQPARMRYDRDITYGLVSSGEGGERDWLIDYIAGPGHYDAPTLDVPATN